MERRYGPGWLRDDDDDKVPHARLMNKVRAHGVKGLVANWIENWLKDRYFQLFRFRISVRTTE